MTLAALDRAQLREALADATLAAASITVQARGERRLDLAGLAGRLLTAAHVALTARGDPADAELLAAIDRWLDADELPPAPAAAAAPPAAPPPADTRPVTHLWRATADELEMHLLDERRVVVARVTAWTDMGTGETYYAADLVGPHPPGVTVPTPRRDLAAACRDVETCLGVRAVLTLPEIAA